MKFFIFVLLVAFFAANKVFAAPQPAPEGRHPSLPLPEPESEPETDADRLAFYECLHLNCSTGKGLCQTTAFKLRRKRKCDHCAIAHCGMLDFSPTDWYRYNDYVDANF